MDGWWRQLEADLDAAERAIEREHQAAIAAGKPWPPQHTAQAQATHAHAAAVITRLQRDGYLQECDPDPEIPAPGSAAQNPKAPAAQHEADDRAVRLDDLQARADEAAYRIGADHAEREARAEYMARLEREAHTQAEPAAGREAEASDGIEIEL